MPRERFRSLLVALSGLLLAACTTPQAAALLEDRGDLPARAEVAQVPFFPQEDNDCGPAALATLLTWSGAARDPRDLAPEVYTPERQGTLQNDILAGARRAGRLAVEVATLRDLLGELAAGHPVLVFQNLALAAFPQWHYAVAVAYDLQTGEIVLRSGRERRRVLALSTFERTWSRGGDWALLVLPPDKLPAAASSDAVVRAAVGLEQAGKLKEAATAYGTILERWPDSYVALMGLGNVHYGQGDRRAAEQAFRRAIAESPERPEAWNNLAHVLAAEGRHDEALEAAQRAVNLSPDSDRPYRETLKEISRS